MLGAQRRKLPNSCCQGDENKSCHPTKHIVPRVNQRIWLHREATARRAQRPRCRAGTIRCRDHLLHRSPSLHGIIPHFQCASPVWTQQPRLGFMAAGEIGGRPPTLPSNRRSLRSSMGRKAIRRRHSCDVRSCANGRLTRSIFSDCTRSIDLNDDAVLREPHKLAKSASCRDTSLHTNMLKEGKYRHLPPRHSIVSISASAA